MRAIALVIGSLLFSMGAAAEDTQVAGTDFAVDPENVPAKGQPYSPFVGQDLPNRVPTLHWEW